MAITQYAHHICQQPDELMFLTVQQVTMAGRFLIVLVCIIPCYAWLSNEGHYAGYVGCFLDDSNRHLKNRIAPINGMTLEKCRHHCSGYRYMGLQYGYYCLCGDYLHHKAYPQASELLCNMPCRGETHRMCGARYKNSIYEV